jgi:diguanylate cyclase (GGDEF)-like protein
MAKKRKSKSAEQKKKKKNDTGDAEMMRREIEALKQEFEALREEKEQTGVRCTELETKATLADGLRRNLGIMVGKMDLLARLSREFNSFNLDKITMAAVVKVPMLVRATSASLYLCKSVLGGSTEPSGHLELACHTHRKKIEEKISLSDNKNSLMAEAARKKSVMLIEDLAEYEREHGMQFSEAFSDSYESNSCIIMPLVTRNRLIGILNICDKEDKGAFDPFHDLPVIKQVADILATAIENCLLFSEVHEQSRIDGLTRLLNHNTFYAELEKEVARCRRYQRKLALIVFDLDHFKKINDTHGHQAGDYILQEVSEVVRSVIRNIDIASRYGGDEFCIILPETETEGAMIATNRLIDTVRNHTFRFEKFAYSVRISVGVAGLLDKDAAKDLVRRADEALLEAKRQGRDRIVCADEMECELQDD